MTAKPYVPVTWGDEPVFTDKLNQMTNNDQYLFENSPKMYYNSYNLKKTSGVRIMGGVLGLPATTTRYRSGTAYFGTFFSAGCRPIVVASVNPMGSGVDFSLTLRGVDSVYIDYRGFRAHVYHIVQTKDAARSYIHWIAMGW